MSTVAISELSWVVYYIRLVKKVLFSCEVRSKNELIPSVCHTIINRPVSE